MTLYIYKKKILFVQINGFSRYFNLLNQYHLDYFPLFNKMKCKLI